MRIGLQLCSDSGVSFIPLVSLSVFPVSSASQAIDPAMYVSFPLVTRAAVTHVKVGKAAEVVPLSKQKSPS